MKRLFSLFLVIILMSPFQVVSAQGDLESLAQENAKKYIQPFITSFGMNMNSGLTHTAKVHGILGFDISIKAMVDVIPDEAKTFDFDVSGLEWSYMDVTIPGSVLFTDTELPTVFGTEGTLTADRDNVANYLNDALGTNLTGEDIPSEIDNVGISLAGLDMTTVPMFRPQLGLGLPLKTELLLSYIPIPLGDLGDASFRAFGLKHKLDQYFPLPTPFLNLSLQAVYQSLDLDIIKSTHTNLNIQASADMPFITAYALVGLDKSNLEASYTIESPGSPLDGQEVGFELEGENGLRTTFGVTLKMLLFYLNADYTLGEHNVLSLGAGITFR
ncbi:MAG: DUF6588 family protein [Fidelibacterota bacterium]